MPRERLLTRGFVLCAAANFLQALAFNLFLHLPGFLKQLGAGEVGIGLLFGVTALAAIAVRPPLGRSLDRHGRRGVILCGGVLNTLVCSLYLTVDAIGPWLVAVRLLHGFAEAMLFASLFTLAADGVPPGRRTEGLALFGVSGMLPISVAGLLGDAILARSSYAGVFLAAALLAASSLLISLPLRESRLRADGDPPSRGFLAAAGQHDLVPLWFIGTVFAMGLAGVFTFAKTFVLETGAGSLGVFLSAHAGAAILLRLFLAWLPDRVGPKRVLFPALASLALGLGCLAFARGSAEVAAAGALCGLGHGYAFPILSGLVVTRARAEERGAALSLFTALFDLGVVLGGPLFGAVVHAAGYAAMFVSAAALVCAGALVFACWDRAPLRSPDAAGARG